jgi:hypothetical protein
MIIHDSIAHLEAVRYHLLKDGIVVIELPTIFGPQFLACHFTGIKKFVFLIASFNAFFFMILLFQKPTYRN